MLKSVACASGALVAVSWAYLRHIQLAPGPSRLEWDRLVFGHRGCREMAGIPENTLEAFQYAHNNGANGIELDVRLTKDKQMVIFHDSYTSPTLESEPKRLVSSFSLHELKAMRYCDDLSGETKIPTLEEAILFCKDNYLQVLIEVKERQDPKTLITNLLELYEKHGVEYMYDNTTVICFSPFVLYALRKRNPRIAVGQLHSGELLTHWASVSHIEPVPMIIERGPTRAMDVLLNWIQSVVAPWVVGVSMMLPKKHLYDHDVWLKWTRRRKCIFLWGFTNEMDVADMFTPEMRRIGVSVIVDGKYAAYGAYIQQAKEEELEARRAQKAAERERQKENW